MHFVCIFFFPKIVCIFAILKPNIYFIFSISFSFPITTNLLTFDYHQRIYFINLTIS